MPGKSKKNIIHDNGLTPLQELFAEEYCVDLNITLAAKRAGYADNSHAIYRRLMGNPLVIARIREIMEERSETLKVTQGWVVEQLLGVHRRCMEGSYIDKGEDMGKFKFDAPGAIKSLELIGKHIGMFSDKLVHEVVGKMSDEELIKKAKAILDGKPG